MTTNEFEKATPEERAAAIAERIAARQRKGYEHAKDAQGREVWKSWPKFKAMRDEWFVAHCGYKYGSACAKDLLDITQPLIDEFNSKYVYIKKADR